MRLLGLCKNMTYLQFGLIEIVALIVTILLLIMVQIKNYGEAVAIEVFFINIKCRRETIHHVHSVTCLLPQLLHNLLNSLLVFCELYQNLLYGIL